MPSFNLTISPAQIEYLLKPGGTITQAYEITNNSSENIYLNTEVLPFIPQGNNGSVAYKNISANPNITFSLSNSNLSLGQPFVIGPNSKQQLVLKIKTSTDIKLTDSYYTFFVYQTQNQSNFTQATGKIGSHILLSVSDTENTKINGEITKFTVEPKIKDVFFTPLKFNGEVKNNSDFFFKTSGNITITKNNQTIKEIKLSPNNVLNHHYRQINCQDPVNCTISPPLWPGRYTATLSFDQNLNVKPISISFFVFPISPILFLISITLIIIFITKIKKLFSKPKI